MPLAQKAQEAGFLVRRLGHEPPDTTQSILTRLRELYPSCGFSYTDAPETQGLHIVLPVADLKQGLPKAVLYAATRILRRRADGSLYRSVARKPRPLGRG